MSFVNGKLVFGDQYGDLAGYVEEEMSGYVPPSAVAVDLSTKASFGFAHRGRASGLLGRPHGRAPQRRNSAPPTSHTAHLLMSAQPVGFAV